MLWGGEVNKCILCSSRIISYKTKRYSFLSDW